MKQEYYAGINNLLAKGVISQEEYSERINKIALK
jgi:hypothetical protein